MGTHFVKEGNAFYEIDDDCLKRKELERQKAREKGEEERKEKTEKAFYNRK